jgi:transcriptional regulator with XRE-family HTH domain
VPKRPRPRARVVSPETDSAEADAGVLIGPLLAATRKKKKWTLSQLAKASGVAIGTLSKIENGKSGASFDTVVRVANALEMSFDALLGPNSARFASGRRSISRAGEGLKFGFGRYDYEIPCNDLVSKAMVPLVMTINAREIALRSKWQSHAGEEYIYIISGEVQMHTEFYVPVTLQTGDSAYIDSMMAHAFVNVGSGDAKMLSVCLSGSLEELFGRRATLAVGGAVTFDIDKD